MLTPFERYHIAISSGKYFADSAQAHAIEHLQRVYRELEEIYQQKKLQRLLKKQKTPQGLYLWGHVGIGKTWLMDLFFESLSHKNKMRVHFHEFMKTIHDQLQRWQGTKNPLDKIAEELAKKAKIICFDEFFVSDIGDAMILGNLFAALFKNNIVIVATSNCAPDELYKQGLQRAKFIPAINLIKKHMDVFHVQTTQDYRLRTLKQAGLYFFPHHADKREKFKTLFLSIADGDILNDQELIIQKRSVMTIAHSNNCVWFDFHVLCHTPRSQHDYLELAKKYSYIFLSNVRHIRPDETNIAQYFINLVDICYDKKIILPILSDVAIEHIYTDGDLAFEFRRTKSRLIEMQSEEYLNHPL